MQLYFASEPWNHYFELLTDAKNFEARKLAETRLVESWFGNDDYSIAIALICYLHVNFQFEDMRKASSIIDYLDIQIESQCPSSSYFPSLYWNLRQGKVTKFIEEISLQKALKIGQISPWLAFLLLNYLGIAYLWIGRYSESILSFETAQKLSHSLGSYAAFCYSRTLVAEVHWARGDPQSALENTLAIREYIQDKERLLLRSMADCIDALVAIDRGDFENAETMFQELISRFNAYPHGWTTAVYQGNLAIVLYFQGKIAEAREAYLKSLRIFERLGTGQEVARTHANLAFLELDAGDPLLALTKAKKALGLLEKTFRHYALALGVMGLSLLQLERYEAARDALYDATLLLKQGEHVNPILVWFLLGITDLEIKENHLEKAMQSLEEAEIISVIKGYQNALGHCLLRRGRYELARSNLDRASYYFELCIQKAQEVKSTTLEGVSRIGLIGVFLKRFLALQDPQYLNLATEETAKTLETTCNGYPEALTEVLEQLLEKMKWLSRLERDTEFVVEEVVKNGDPQYLGFLGDFPKLISSLEHYAGQTRLWKEFLPIKIEESDATQVFLEARIVGVKEDNELFQEKLWQTLSQHVFLRKMHAKELALSLLASIPNHSMPQGVLTARLQELGKQRNTVSTALQQMEKENLIKRSLEDKTGKTTRYRITLTPHGLESVRAVRLLFSVGGKPMIE